MPEIPITPPQVIPSTYISRKYYNVSGDNTQNFGTPANTTSIGQISVYMDGKDIPSDSADYPWIFNDEEKEVQFRTGGVPPEGAGLEVDRDIFLDFGKTGFPSGYTLDARVLNRIFNQSLFQSQELIEDGDYAWNAWSNSSLLPAPTPTQTDNAMMATAGGSWVVKTSGPMKTILGLGTTSDFGSLSVSSTDLSSVNSVISEYTTVDNISAVDVSSGVHGKLYHSQTTPNTYETQPDNFSHDLVLKSFGVEADSTLSSHSTNLGLELSSASSLNFTVLNHFWFGTTQPLGGNNSIGTQVGAANRVGLHSALHIDSSGNFFPFYASTNIHQIVNPTVQYPDKILPKIASKGNLIAGKAISVAGNSESGLYGGGYLEEMLGGAYTTPESNIKAAANLPDVLINMWSDNDHHRDRGVNAPDMKVTGGKVTGVWRFIRKSGVTDYDWPQYLIKFNRKIAPNGDGGPNLDGNVAHFRSQLQATVIMTNPTSRQDVYYSIVTKNTPQWNSIMGQIFPVQTSFGPKSEFPNKTNAGGLGSTIFKTAVDTGAGAGWRTDAIILSPRYVDINEGVFKEDAYPQPDPNVIQYTENISLALWFKDESEFN